MKYIFLDYKTDSLLKVVQLRILYILMRISLMLFSVKIPDSNKYIIGASFVNTYGDSLYYYSYLKLKAIKENKKIIIICTTSNPAFDIIKCILNKDEYIVYNNIVYNVILFFIQKKYARSSIDYVLMWAIRKKYTNMVLFTFDELLGRKEHYVNGLNQSSTNKNKHIRCIDNIIRHYKSFNFNFLLKRLDYYNLLEKNDIHNEFLNKFSDRYKEEFSSLKRRIGINKRYVCLHIKEYDFNLSAEQQPRGIKSPNNYISAISYILTNGFQVVLLGKNKFRSIFIDESGFIDYQNSGFQSILNDLILINGCDFYIGNNSGPYDGAIMFKKPIMLINCVGINEHIPLHDKVRFFPKLFKKCSTGEIIDPFEQIDRIESMTNQLNIEDQNGGIKLLELTSEEVLNSAKEMIDVVNSDSKKNRATELQQIYFQKKMPHHLMLYISDSLPFNGYLIHSCINKMKKL